MATDYFDLIRREPKLVSYWRLNDPVGSTIAIDYSAHNSLDGSYSGNSSVTPALIQADPVAASRLMVPSSGLSIPDITQLRLTQELSIEAWVAPTGPNQSGTIFSKLDSTGQIAAPYSLALNNGAITISVGNGSSQTVFEGPLLPVGIPSRVCGTLFRGTLFLAVNGSPYTTLRFTGGQAVADAGQPVSVGCSSCLVGEVALYSGALSVLKHARHFAVGQQLLSDPAHFITVDPPSIS